MIGLGLGLGFSAKAQDAFTPIKLPGLLLWLRADLGVTTATGVSAWADQSGAGDTNRNAVQASGALQPALNVSDAHFGGKASISFTGSQQLKTGAFSTPPAQPFTAIVVGQATTAGKYAFDSISGGECTLFESAGAKLYAGAFSTPTGTILSTASVVVCVMNGAASTVRVSQDTPGFTGNIGTNSLTGFYVGNTQGGGAFAGWDIAEMVVVSGALSDTDAAKVNNYARIRYGITIGA